MIKLDTQDEIATAGARVLDMRYALDAGGALTRDEQQLLAQIAYTALLRLKPVETQRWVDTGAVGPVPEWLQGEIDRREPAEEQPNRQRAGEYVVPADGRPVYCRSCGASIVWTRTEGGKAIPLSLRTVEERGGTRYALTHFADCEHSREWRRR